MKKLIFLFISVFILSYNLKAQTSNPIENKTGSFRNYEWGTPMSVILNNEGKPDKSITAVPLPSTTIPAIFYDLEILLDAIGYNSIQIAGYECEMSFGFYNDKLVLGEYNFLSTAFEKLQTIHIDLLRKLTLLYGEPKISKQEYSYISHRASWDNIYLYYYIDSTGKEELILTYISYDYIIKQKKIDDEIRKNNTTGL